MKNLNKKIIKYNSVKKISILFNIIYKWLLDNMEV